MSRKGKGLHLGGVVDPGTGDRTGEPVVVPPHHLTTHGVVVGMTGSGKTGLGIVLLEEALSAGIPALVLDPKGDMGNLLLTFPELQPADFRPWIDPAEAERKGVDLDDLAASTAEAWKGGLASWGIDGDRIRTLRESAEITIYTPGSSAGVGLNMLGSLRAPGPDWDAHEEATLEEIEGFVSGLLTVAGLKTDPLSSPEHILLSNIIEHAWRGGRDLALPDLIRFIQDPPFRKLGVFALEEFYPEADRRKLAVRLNGLMASPSFSAWLEGRPLDLEAMIRTPDGRPACSIIHLAHLSDAERQFVVTLLLSRLVTWMRQQPGTSDLRLLVYMDEMFGFAPPTAQPPTKKPILTVFKQGRAHGVGMVVSTQNPVDLDYKVMSNAGTWMLGRLQTERDKARVLEGLSSASGGVDLATVDHLLSGLRKREFVLRTTRSPEPVVFTTRWAMSYLRGNLTREEVSRLAGDTAPDPSDAQASGAGAAAEPAEDESPLAPKVPDSVPVYYLDPAAAWASEVGAVPGSGRFEPALVARLRLTFDDRYAGVDHTEEWEAVFFPLGPRVDSADAIHVDYDDRDLRPGAPEDARYVLGEAPLTSADFYKELERDLTEHVYREREVTVFKNAELKLYSWLNEDRETFIDRCRRAAEARADEDVAKLRDRFETRIERAQEALAKAESRVRELEVDVSTRKQQEIVAGAGKLISMFLKGRASASGLSGAASRRSMTRRTEERLRSARERQAEKEDAIQELEDELADEIQDIVDEWDAKATELETVDIGLEKNDISVDEVGLLWVPR